MEDFIIVPNVIFCCVIGIVDVFFTMISIKRWGMTTRKGESFFVALLLQIMISTPLFNFSQQKVTVKL